MKKYISGLAAPAIAALFLLMTAAGCKDVLIVEHWYPYCPENGDSQQDGSGNQGGSGTGSNLVSFHASVESLNLSTKSMSPISEDTKLTIYAFHGSMSDATTSSAVARGTYTAQKTGSLTGDSGYRMLLTNGNFDFYAVSTNTSDMPPVFSNGISHALVNGVDYLWWNIDNYDVMGSQVTVPIVLGHAATQVSFEIDNGDGMYVTEIVSATITVPEPGAKMDLSTGVIPPATEYAEVPASMGINGMKLQYTMLPLKTDQPMQLELHLYANAEPDIKTYKVEVPVPDGELAAGNSYRFKAVIEGSDVSFPAVNVTDWVDVDETGNPLYPH